MNQLLKPTLNDELDTPASYPSVSIIMPFEPKMKSKRELSNSLNNAFLKAENELLENYDLEMAVTVIQKLNNIISELDYSTHKKSIAIYVSPVFEKILYLELDVEERIRVDDSFAIRELINSKKEGHEYLLLVLNEKESKMYLSDDTNFSQVFANCAACVQPNQNNTEISFIENYLRHIDSVLEIILPSFKVPLFVCGDKKINEQFKNITNHTSSIVEYIEHDNDNLSLSELKKITDPFIRNWERVKQVVLLNQLRDASLKQKVVTGINNVFRKAAKRLGHLLLIEKNYCYPSGYGTNEELLDKATQPYSPYSYVKDAVDDIIEKVLEEDGDVEFVDKEILKGYDRIALIL